MRRQISRQDAHQNTTMPYISNEMSAIMHSVTEKLQDESLSQCLHFSPTVLTLLHSMLLTKSTVIVDTPLVKDGMDSALLGRFGINPVCFLEDREVVANATQRHVTRAEVAFDIAMRRVEGPKLFVIGSAPGMLGELLARCGRSSSDSIAVIASPNGFASAVSLKEKLWDSNLPCIVARGKAGGPNVAISIFNAVMEQTISRQA